MASRSPPPKFDDRLYCSVRDACALSSLGRTAIYGLIADGLLDTFKNGARRLIIVQSLKSLPDRLAAGEQGRPKS